MKPVIALVGRPNVGKSTLFNRLTRSRDALVADIPGLTRDRLYGEGRLGGKPYLVVDTGGLGMDEAGIDALMAEQARQALLEADHVLWLVDARSGLTAADEQIADWLRRSGKPVWLVANKVDGLDAQAALADFHALGMGRPWPISAAHGRGVRQLIEAVLAGVPAPDAEQEADRRREQGIRVALLGRPNVGKSTLLNRMLGYERVIAYDQPGTTRDSIYVPFERDGRRYTLIDTAGIRRRSRVRATLEKFSVLKALQAMAEADVVILLMDAREGVVEQDLTLLHEVLERGRALIPAVNKWDGLDEAQRRRVLDELERRLAFLDFTRVHRLSALHGTGVGELFERIERAYENAGRELPTPLLNRLLQEALVRQSPPRVRSRRPKLRYAHQGGRHPPRIVIHGSALERLPADYRRYLRHWFQHRLGLSDTPLELEFRNAPNPYVGDKDRR
ncbi:MAG: GTPase Der [Gammaproteobacteria bacterium]|nr:MAG: GTPase Der [Gammaproteobacteria bacterium]